MEEKQNKQQSGTISFVLGIIGIIALFFLSHLIGLALGIIAFILSLKPKKQGDRYGLYGFILGLICIILGIIAIWSYAYVSTML